MFDFTIDQADAGSGARVGRVTTPHGAFDTPAFMPVGTRGSVKGVTPDQLIQSGCQIILANTYHLHVRPGEAVVRELGGLHAFCGWRGPILTDSGGYQVFSLAELNQISDAGVTFRSHVDGALLQLDAARAIEIQTSLGGDIIMAFDQCPPLPSPRAPIEAAVGRTIRWAAECKRVHVERAPAIRRAPQWLFGIVQGGLELDLRRECAAALCDIGFDGYAIGGLSVGETHEQMLEVLGDLVSRLPVDRPRYLMGVGMPRDIVAAVRCGIDMFDCVLPTRNARSAFVFTAHGALRMRNEIHRGATGPIEDGCDCYACRTFSRGYVRHLFMAGEMLGPILATLHNLRFYQRLMARIRYFVRCGNLASITHEFPIASGSASP